MIRALIFDFDGLILDTETPLHASWAEIYGEHGLTVSPAAWASLLGASADPPEMYELLEAHLDRPVDRPFLRERRLRRELELLKHEVIMPGVSELVAAADARGLRMAVASSSERSWVENHLSRLGLRERFSAVVCAEDVERTKPDPALYIEALKRLDARAEEAIAFEDSDHGTRAASAAGIFCVAVPNGITRHAQFPSADLIANSLAENSLEAYIQAAEGRRRKGSRR
jgi:HAD superfamily hydrolase (TIGR01509 family)